jgi:hypothetical protein
MVVILLSPLLGSESSTHSLTYITCRFLSSSLHPLQLLISHFLHLTTLLSAQTSAHIFSFFVAFLYSGSSIRSFHYITIASLRFIFRQSLSFISLSNRDLILLRTFISIYIQYFCLSTTAKDNIAYVSTQVIQKYHIGNQFSRGQCSFLLHPSQHLY